MFVVGKTIETKASSFMIKSWKKFELAHLRSEDIYEWISAVFEREIGHPRRQICNAAQRLW